MMSVAKRIVTKKQRKTCTKSDTSMTRRRKTRQPERLDRAYLHVSSDARKTLTFHNVVMDALLQKDCRCKTFNMKRFYSRPNLFVSQTVAYKNVKCNTCVFIQDGGRP